MKRKIFITDAEWFDSGSLKNPLSTLDEELEKYFPEFSCLDYDTRILATAPPTKEEQAFIPEDDYRKKYGRDSLDLSALCFSKGAINILLNGFDQELFEYIVPAVKDTAEVIYFFKCPGISDLSMLSDFPNLRCVHVFCNNSLTRLWDMTDSANLKAISMCRVTGLREIEALTHSHVRYVHIDSMDNCGTKKPALFSVPSFEEIPELLHLSLGFSNHDLQLCRRSDKEI